MFVLFVCLFDSELFSEVIPSGTHHGGSGPQPLTPAGPFSYRTQSAAEPRLALALSVCRCAILLSPLVFLRPPWRLTDCLSSLFRREGCLPQCQRNPQKATLPWPETARWRAPRSSVKRRASAWWRPSEPLRCGRTRPQRAQTASRSIFLRPRPDYETAKHENALTHKRPSAEFRHEHNTSHRSTFA